MHITCSDAFASKQEHWMLRKDMTQTIICAEYVAGTGQAACSHQAREYNSREEHLFDEGMSRALFLLSDDCEYARVDACMHAANRTIS